VKVSSITLSGAMNLDMDDFHQVLDMTKDSLDSLNIFQTFDEPDRTLDLSGVKLKKLQLRENNFKAKLGDNLNLQNFEFYKQPLENEKLNIFLNRSQPDENNEIELDWCANSNGQKDQFTPHFFSSRENDSDAKIILNIRPSFHQRYLKKETLINAGKIYKLCLPINYYRIEYGALSNGDQLIAESIAKSEDNDNSCKDQPTSANFSDIALKDKWVKGQCKYLPKFICELCFMHQYGLHKYDDNVTTLCSRNTRDDEFKGEMVHCYWDDIEPAPEEMKQQGGKSLQTLPYTASTIRLKEFCRPKDIKPPPVKNTTVGRGGASSQSLSVGVTPKVKDLLAQSVPKPQDMNDFKHANENGQFVVKLDKDEIENTTAQHA
ncbi:uncharacterized protein LOC142357926, partial [Convolutriloba macropyga]|uniref:uncharacterized protein LOC142357926 n=1 Tax=Convolutriloba macropyga TaxID=536237 RepID=UPI003F51C904